MADPVISISLDLSEESVGSHAPRVILFCAIPVIIPVILEVPIVPTDPLVTPKVGAIFVTSPVGVLDLVDYSSFASDPSEDSLPPAPELPLVLPFLCSDDSEADIASRPSSPLGSSSRDTLAPSFKFPLALVVTLHRIRQRPVILTRPGEAIPFGRPYHTHPTGSCKLLTAKKRIGPFLARRLAWRHVSHRSSDHHSSPDFTSDSSSSGSSSNYSDLSSFGSPLDSLLIQDHRLGLHHLELSLDSSSKRSLDSSLLSAGSYRKRCRSPNASVPSSTPVLRPIAPTHADLLPPRKRFKDSYSLDDSIEEHMEIGTADAEAIAYLGIGDGFGAHTKNGIGVGVKIATSDIKEDEDEFEAEASAGGTIEIVVDPLVSGGIFESTRRDVPDLEDTIYDIVHYMLEVPRDKITEFKTAQRQLEAGQLIPSRERERWFG
nr:hypothetical protein [Tanacetum cinerariifolium]